MRNVGIDFRLSHIHIFHSCHNYMSIISVKLGQLHQSERVNVLCFRCRSQSYNTTAMPNVSVVITFHDNEHLTDIVRTVQSIVARTPQNLLYEIILVDDYSKKGASRFLTKFGYFILKPI